MGGSPAVPNWEESNSGGASVLRFSGVDQAAVDEQELKTFQYTSKLETGTTAVRPGGGDVRLRDRILPYLFPLLVGFYLAGLVLRPLGLVTSPLACVAVSVILCTLFALANRARDRRIHPPPIPNAAFRIGIGGDEFSVEGARRGRLSIPLDDIASFEGDRRLHVVMQNGTRQLLPCRLDAPSQSDLARRLDTLVREAKAERAGYRGIEPRVRIASEELAISAEEESLDRVDALQEPRVKRL